MIYFLRCVDRSIKIGYARDVQLRMRSLSDSCKLYEGATLLKSITGDRRREGNLHRFFGRLRIYKNRELFAPGRYLMGRIGRLDLAVDDPASFCREHWESHRDRLSDRRDGSSFHLVPNWMSSNWTTPGHFTPSGVEEAPRRKFLTLSGAAKEMQVDPAWLKRHLRDNDIETFRVSNMIVITAEQLDHAKALHLASFSRADLARVRTGVIKDSPRNPKD